MLVDPLQMPHSDTAEGVVTVYGRYAINVPAMSSIVNDL